MSQHESPEYWEPCEHDLTVQERRENGVWCEECERLVSWERPDGTVCDVRSTAVILAEETGRPREEFEYDPDEYPMPDPEDLLRIPAEEFNADSDTS